MFSFGFFKGFVLFYSQTSAYHSPISSNRNQDLHQIKLAIQAHSKRAQDPNQYRTTAHTQTAYGNNNLAETTDKSVQANHEPRSMDRGMC